MGDDCLTCGRLSYMDYVCLTCGVFHVEVHLVWKMAVLHLEINLSWMGVGRLAFGSLSYMVDDCPTSGLLSCM